MDTIQLRAVVVGGEGELEGTVEVPMGQPETGREALLQEAYRQLRVDTAQEEEEMDGDDHSDEFEFVITEQQLRVIFQMQFAVWRRWGTTGWAEWRKGKEAMDLLGQTVTWLMADYNGEVFDELWQEISR